MLISNEYLDLQKQLHAKGRYGVGVNSRRCADAIDTLRAGMPATVLDYGAGNGHLARLLNERGILRVQEYDPCVAGKDAEPSPADIVVCSDVLEHIEPDCLEAVLRHIRLLAIQQVILAIATTPAAKRLADGRNAHLIIEGSAWWQRRLLPHFHLGIFADEHDKGNGLFIVGRPR